MSEHEGELREHREREEYLKEELRDERREEERLEEALEEVRKQEHRTEEEIRREEKHKPSRSFYLVFVINGESTETACSPRDLLKTAVEKALQESGNTGRRELSEWEVRNEAGVLLEMGREIERLDLKEGTHLYLSLKVAAGGAHEG